LGKKLFFSCFCVSFHFQKGILSIANDKRVRGNMWVRLLQEKGGCTGRQKIQQTTSIVDGKLLFCFLPEFFPGTDVMIFKTVEKKIAFSENFG
jgi:hypothetical protein